jgi:hypothetical protein
VNVRPIWVLLALLAAAVLLVAVELAQGAIGYGSGKLANPCVERTFPGGGLDAALQRIVLDGLDGAACRLGTSREELVLALGGGASRWNRRQIDTALRAGMLTAVDRAEARGDIPAIVAPLLRKAIEHAPIDQLVRGAISLRDLIG